MEPLVHPAQGSAEGGEDDAELYHEHHALALDGALLLQRQALTTTTKRCTPGFQGRKGVDAGEAFAPDGVRCGSDGALKTMDLLIQLTGTTLQVPHFGAASRGGEFVNCLGGAGADLLVHEERGLEHQLRKDDREDNRDDQWQGESKTAAQPGGEVVVAAEGHGHEAAT